MVPSPLIRFFGGRDAPSISPYTGDRGARSASAAVDVAPRPGSAIAGGSAAGRLRPRYPADPPDPLLRVPRSTEGPREAAAGPACRGAQGGRDRPRARSRQQRREPDRPPRARPRRRRSDAEGRRSPAARADCAASRVDRSGSAVARWRAHVRRTVRGSRAAGALGVSRAGPSRAANGAQRELGPEFNRSIRPGAARNGESGALTRGAVGHAGPPRVARPDRSAPVA
jgi:hypothetical protein